MLNSISEAEQVFNLQQTIRNNQGASTEELYEIITKSQKRVDKIKEEIQSLCANKYPAFLKTVECSSHLRASVDQIK